MTTNTPPDAQMPPLPIAAISLRGKKGKTFSEAIDYYTVDQMQAHAAQRCAELVEMLRPFVDFPAALTGLEGNQFTSVTVKTAHFSKAFNFVQALDTKEQQ